MGMLSPQVKFPIQLVLIVILSITSKSFQKGKGNMYFSSPLKASLWTSNLGTIPHDSRSRNTKCCFHCISPELAFIGSNRPVFITKGTLKKDFPLEGGTRTPNRTPRTSLTLIRTNTHHFFSPPVACWHLTSLGRKMVYGNLHYTTTKSYATVQINLCVELKIYLLELKPLTHSTT